MTGKPKFLRTTRELFGPHPRQFINDILYIYSDAAQSKGGHAKAEKNATAVKSRYQKIRAEFMEGMKVPDAKRHKVVAALAKKHKRSTDRINRILRQG